MVSGLNVTGDGVRLSKVVNCARSCGEGCEEGIDMERVKGEWVLICVKLESKCGGKSKGKLTDPEEPVYCCESLTNARESPYRTVPASRNPHQSSVLAMGR